MRLKYLYISIILACFSIGQYTLASENVYLKYSGIYGTLSATYGRMFLNKTDISIKIYQSQLLDPKAADPGSYFLLDGNAQGLFPSPSGVGVSFMGGAGSTFFKGWLYLGVEGFYQFTGGVSDSTVYINQVDEQYSGPLNTFLFYAQLKNKDVFSYGVRVGSVLDGTLLFVKVSYKKLNTEINIDYGAQSNIASLKAIQLEGVDSRGLKQNANFEFLEVGLGAERKIASRFSVRGDIGFGFTGADIPLNLDNEFNKFTGKMSGNEVLLSVGITYFFYEF